MTERTSERPNNIPICSACFDFTPDGNKFEKFTIVVAPIVSSHLGDGIWKTAWACSRGKFCKNRECIYSKGSSSRNDESEGESPFYSVGVLLPLRLIDLFREAVTFRLIV